MKKPQAVAIHQQHLHGDTTSNNGNAEKELGVRNSYGFIRSRGSRCDDQHVW
ncbi:hypothetical protein O9993_10965 [Vibrio lentus]|nr:hypothetical protein [Vibrio lentus]